MSFRRRLWCAVGSFLLLSTASPAGAGDDAWITIERGVSRYAEAGLAGAGHPGALVVVDAGASDALSDRARDTDIVVARVDQRAIDVLPEILHPFVRHGPGFVRRQSREDAEAAAARTNTRLVHRIPEPAIPYTIDNGPVVHALMGQAQEINARNTITSLGAFFTRRHNCQTGLESAAWIRDTWLALAAGRPDVTVEYWAHPNTPQPSVILTIQGGTLPSEIVVLGGHQDSTAGSNCTTSRSPGEDDDASGIANLTEVIRVAMALNYRPSRTVQFMAYAAEEAGLLGSEHIALTYRQQDRNVVGVLQLDMTNYKGSAGDVYLFTNQTDPTLNAFVQALLNAYLPTLVHQQGNGCNSCSDHASWWERGYPASWPFEATIAQSNPWIHTANDLITVPPSGGNADHAHKFTRLAAAYLAEVAKGFCAPASNQTPIANAGVDHAASPLFTVLDGRASTDPDAWPAQLTYSWTQVSGPPVKILEAQTPVARFRAPHLRSSYVFRLTVTDGCATAADEVTIVPRTEP
jgi:leucyl aminopeptidase